MRRGLLIVGVLLLLSVIPLYAAAPPTVGLSLSTLNNPFFVDLRDGAQAAAKKMNVNLVVLDAQNDSAREASQIEDLIQKKVAVIAINPTDSDAIAPTIRKVRSEEHTSELQSPCNLVCRLLLEKKKLFTYSLVTSCINYSS